jgi:hypothetical protein
MSDSTSEGAKTVITMVPFWGFYRTWAGDCRPILPISCQPPPYPANIVPTATLSCQYPANHRHILPSAALSCQLPPCPDILDVNRVRTLNCKPVTQKPKTENRKQKPETPNRVRRICIQCDAQWRVTPQTWTLKPLILRPLNLKSQISNPKP